MLSKPVSQIKFFHVECWFTVYLEYQFIPPNIFVTQFIGGIASKLHFLVYIGLEFLCLMIDKKNMLATYVKYSVTRHPEFPR